MQVTAQHLKDAEDFVVKNIQKTMECELYAPALVVQRKWHTATRNLCPGDVVIVADKNTLRGDYRLALVQDVFPGGGGKVRLGTELFECRVSLRKPLLKERDWARNLD